MFACCRLLCWCSTVCYMFVSVVLGLNLSLSLNLFLDSHSDSHWDSNIHSNWNEETKRNGTKQNKIKPNQLQQTEMRWNHLEQRKEAKWNLATNSLKRSTLWLYSGAHYVLFTWLGGTFACAHLIAIIYHVVVRSGKWSRCSYVLIIAVA